MKFEKTYPVRAAEMSPEYRLKKYYIGMYFQECFAEYAASVGLAAFDTAENRAHLAGLRRAGSISRGKCRSGAKT